MPGRFLILEEASQKTGGLLKVSCSHMSVADERNANGRVYPKAIWEREIGKLQESIGENRNIGSLDHPGDGLSRGADAAIRWSKIWMDGNVTKGEGYVLKTQKGLDLEALIRGGVTVDISSRAWGTLLKQKWKGQLAEIATEDLSIVTFDAVLGGSVSGAHLKAINEQRRMRAGEEARLTGDQIRQRELAGIS